MEKRLHCIDYAHTNQENETILQGKDENGDELTVVFETMELLEYLDADFMKNQLKKYISNL